MTTDEPLPRALEILWRDAPPARRTGGLSRERIVAAAIELVEAEGLSALSMARLAERLGCGTMSLYRHVANKDELVTFMLSTAPDPPPTPADPSDWRGALTDWAAGSWTSTTGTRGSCRLPRRARRQTRDSWRGWMPGLPRWAVPACPSGTSWRRSWRYSITSAARPPGYRGRRRRWSDDPALLRRVLDGDRFPALAAAVAAGVFDQENDDRLPSFAPDCASCSTASPRRLMLADDGHKWSKPRQLRWRSGTPIFPNEAFNSSLRTPESN